jgi:hypothetical protein
MFFQRMGTETMCARKINQLNRLVVRLQRADVSFDGDARIVTDALSQARQTIKERTFSGIRTTDNRYAGVRLPAYWDVLQEYAGFGLLSHQTRETTR